MAMRLAGLTMVFGALALLVAVVAYDPSPFRIVIAALCCAVAGFYAGRRG